MELPTMNSKEDGIMSDVDDPNQHLPLLPKMTKKTLRGPLAPLNDFFTNVEEGVKAFCVENRNVLRKVMITVVALAWLAYVATACVMDFKRARDLVIITVIVFLCVFYWLAKKRFGDFIEYGILDPAGKCVSEEYYTIIYRVIICLFFISILIWVIVDCTDEPRRLISLVGLFVFPFLGYLFSWHRTEITWRPVLWGFVIQFIVGIFAMRTQIGFLIVKWVCDIVVEFLGFAKKGGAFVLGDNIMTQGMLMILPVLVYISSFTYTLYYLGLLQAPASKVAWLVKTIMGTTTPETFNSILTIFAGQVEASFFIRPFLKRMTESELHVVMAAGFATISGSLFAVYVNMGISPNYLLTAAVMSAPASLAMSKLVYPEVEESEFKDVDEIEAEKTDEKNIFEALAVGATMAIHLVASIFVILIAFVSLLGCVDGILGWLGSMVGVPEFSFEFICSYVFMPVAYIMGVPWKDSFKVAELIGVKLFLNEMIAYKRLMTTIQSNAEGIKLSERSVMIATYALCSFANFGSMGMQLGGLSALAPNKRAVLAKLVFSAMICGSLACFMTASISCLLTDSTHFTMTYNQFNTTISPVTLS